MPFGTLRIAKPLVATERETRNDNYNQSVRNLQAYFGRLHLYYGNFTSQNI